MDDLTRPEFKPTLIGNYLLIEMGEAVPRGRGVLVTSYVTLVAEVGEELHVWAGPDENGSPRYVCARIRHEATRARELNSLILALSGESDAPAE